MIVKINGKELPCSRSTENYERIADYAERCGSYTPLDGMADMIRQTDWYNHESAPALQYYDRALSICGEDVFCAMDSMNKMLMEATPVTTAVYRFIVHRVAIIKDGVENNFLPWDMEAMIWTLSHFV